MPNNGFCEIVNFQSCEEIETCMNLNLSVCKRFLTVFSKVCQSRLIDDFL